VHNPKIFTLCDSAYDSAGALSILKIGDGIYAPTAPLKIPKITAVFRIRFSAAEDGKRGINLSLFNQDGNLLIPPFNKEIQTRRNPNLPSGVNIGIIDMKGIIFQTFGEYDLNLFVDGNLLGSQPIHFQKS
jgi:hypothetical protein